MATARGGPGDSVDRRGRVGARIGTIGEVDVAMEVGALDVTEPGLGLHVEPLRACRPLDRGDPFFAARDSRKSTLPVNHGILQPGSPHRWRPATRSESGGPAYRRPPADRPARLPPRSARHRRAVGSHRDVDRASGHPAPRGAADSPGRLTTGSPSTCGLQGASIFGVARSMLSRAHRLRRVLALPGCGDVRVTAQLHPLDQFVILAQPSVASSASVIRPSPSRWAFVGTSRSAPCAP